MLVDILSRMGCREIPNPTNLRRLIVQVAKHEFLTRPLGALYAFNSGVPATHHPFWNEVTGRIVLLVQGTKFNSKESY